ncbi:MAG: HAD family phosphatase [Rhodobacteraceae bacterium]|nr:HAD family phosphatase [Paracoccaceae bacterium]
MPIEAVIFDIGRVLIDWQPERMFDRHLGPDRRKALFSSVDFWTMNDAVDLGADFDQAVADLASRHPDFAADIRLWHTHWLDMASPEIPGSVHLLRALKARGVPVFALTNFGVTTFQIARAAYPFLDLFDRHYVSGQLRMMKPDPAIYQLVERDCAIAPDRLLFTDDRADNIAAAVRRGWQTHLFEGPQGWSDRLVAETLLRKEEALGHG